MNWTDERVEKLKKLWAEGLSASQIAAQLGGVSRNAVIGKVHRLNLPGRAKAGGAPAAARAPKRTAAPAATAPRNPAFSPRAVARPQAVRPAGIEMTEQDFETETAVEETRYQPAGNNVVVPISRRLQLVQLNERTCKWPNGDPLSEDFSFCGNEAGESGPYCGYHSKIAFQPASERRRSR